MEGKNNTIMLTIIGIATLLIAVVGATFAYFSAILSGDESDTTVTIQSGNVGTVFEGGTVISISDIYPRDEVWATKKFSISSAENAAQAINYTTKLIIDNSTFTADVLKYTLVHGKVCSDVAYETEAACIAGGGTWVNASTENENATLMTEVTTQEGIPASGELILGSGTLPTNEGDIDTHEYELNVYFPDTGTIQNDEQGQILQAHIKIEA